MSAALDALRWPLPLPVFRPFVLGVHVNRDNVPPVHSVALVQAVAAHETITHGLRTEPPGPQDNAGVEASPVLRREPRPPHVENRDESYTRSCFERDGVIVRWIRWVVRGGYFG